MAHHDDLLTLARQMVDRNPGASLEAELRRAVSTAYYALFHLLVYEGTERLVKTAALRPRVARTFEHKHMKAVCHEYAGIPVHGSGQHLHPSAGIVPSGIVKIASAFDALSEARQQADYDMGVHVTHAQAQRDVERAEQAFQEWLVVGSLPATDLFVSELWCRGIPKR